MKLKNKDIPTIYTLRLCCINAVLYVFIVLKRININNYTNINKLYKSVKNTRSFNVFKFN